MSKNSFRKLLKHFYLIDDRYFCAFAVFINLRGEMFVMKGSEMKMTKCASAGCSGLENSSTNLYIISIS